MIWKRFFKYIVPLIVLLEGVYGRRLGKNVKSVKNGDRDNNLNKQNGKVEELERTFDKRMILNQDQESSIQSKRPVPDKLEPFQQNRNEDVARPNMGKKKRIWADVINEIRKVSTKNRTNFFDMGNFTEDVRNFASSMAPKSFDERMRFIDKNKLINLKLALAAEKRREIKSFAINALKNSVGIEENLDLKKNTLESLLSKIRESIKRNDFKDKLSKDNDIRTGLSGDFLPFLNRNDDSVIYDNISQFNNQELNGGQANLLPSNNKPNKTKIDVNKVNRSKVIRDLLNELTNLQQILVVQNLKLQLKSDQNLIKITELTKLLEEANINISSINYKDNTVPEVLENLSKEILLKKGNSNVRQILKIKKITNLKDSAFPVLLLPIVISNMQVHLSQSENKENTSKFMRTKLSEYNKTTNSKESLMNTSSTPTYKMLSSTVTSESLPNLTRLEPIKIIDEKLNNSSNDTIFFQKLLDLVTTLFVNVTETVKQITEGHSNESNDTSKLVAPVNTHQKLSSRRNGNRVVKTDETNPRLNTEETRLIKNIGPLTSTQEGTLSEVTISTKSKYIVNSEFTEPSTSRLMIDTGNYPREETQIEGSSTNLLDNITDMTNTTTDNIRLNFTNESRTNFNSANDHGSTYKFNADITDIYEVNDSKVSISSSIIIQTISQIDAENMSTESVPLNSVTESISEADLIYGEQYKTTILGKNKNKGLILNKATTVLHFPLLSTNGHTDIEPNKTKVVVNLEEVRKEQYINNATVPEMGANDHFIDSSTPEYNSSLLSTVKLIFSPNSVTPEPYVKRGEILKKKLNYTSVNTNLGDLYTTLIANITATVKTLGGVNTKQSSHTSNVAVGLNLNTMPSIKKKDSQMAKTNKNYPRTHDTKENRVITSENPLISILESTTYKKLVSATSDYIQTSKFTDFFTNTVFIDTENYSMGENVTEDPLTNVTHAGKEVSNVATQIISLNITNQSKSELNSSDTDKPNTFYVAQPIDSALRDIYKENNSTLSNSSRNIAKAMSQNISESTSKANFPLTTAVESIVKGDIIKNSKDKNNTLRKKIKRDLHLKANINVLQTKNGYVNVDPEGSKMVVDFEASRRAQYTNNVTVPEVLEKEQFSGSSIAAYKHALSSTVKSVVSPNLVTSEPNITTYNELLKNRSKATTATDSFLDHVTTSFANVIVTVKELTEVNTNESSDASNPVAPGNLYKILAKINNDSQVINNDKTSPTLNKTKENHVNIGESPLTQILEDKSTEEALAANNKHIKMRELLELSTARSLIDTGNYSRKENQTGVPTTPLPYTKTGKINITIETTSLHLMNQSRSELNSTNGDATNTFNKSLPLDLAPNDILVHKDYVSTVANFSSNIIQAMSPIISESISRVSGPIHSVTAHITKKTPAV